MPLFPVAYPDDKPGAGQAAPEAGHRLSQLDGAWVVEAADQAGADACQAWLDAYDDAAEQRAAAKRKAKDEAQRRILAIVPAWKQTNALAANLKRVYELITSGTLSADDQAQVQASLALFDQIIVPIRAASNEIEADIDAMTAAQAHEFDPAASTRWPS